MVSLSTLDRCETVLHRSPTHGQYCHLADKPPVDMKETCRWLKSLNLLAATEGLVVAA